MLPYSSFSAQAVRTLAPARTLPAPVAFLDDFNAVAAEVLRGKWEQDVAFHAFSLCHRLLEEYVRPAGCRGIAETRVELLQALPNVVFDRVLERGGETRLRTAGPVDQDAERLTALGEIEQNLGDLKTAQSEILVDLMLSYRDVSAWDQMVRVTDAFPDYLKANTIVRQQRALALNRRNGPGDREQALRTLADLAREKGADPETLGICGRVHKDRYKDLKKKGSIMASAALDDAIEAYTRGFESDPRDYYPGVNAITLLIEKGNAEALKEADRLVPLVGFAVARRGGATSSDYWDLATVLELSAIGNDWKLVNRVLPKVLTATSKAWMIRTTCDNMLLLKAARERAGFQIPQLDVLIQHLEDRYQVLSEGEAAASN